MGMGMGMGMDMGMGMGCREKVGRLRLVAVSACIAHATRDLLTATNSSRREVRWGRRTIACRRQAACHVTAMARPCNDLDMRAYMNM